MGAEQQNKVMYVIMCVFEYARQHSISVPESMKDLLECGGIEFLDTHYAIEHTLPLEDTLHALTLLHNRKGSVSA